MFFNVGEYIMHETATKFNALLLINKNRNKQQLFNVQTNKNIYFEDIFLSSSGQ